MRKLTSRALAVAAGHITQNRKKYIIFVIFLTVALIYPLRSIEFNSDMDSFAPGKPELKARDYIESNFRTQRNIICIALPAEGAINDTDFLQDIWDAEQSLRAELDGVFVFSLADYLMGSLGAMNISLENAPGYTVDLLINAASRDQNVSGTFNQDCLMILVSIINSSADEEDMGMEIRDLMRDTDDTRFFVLAGFNHDLNEGAVRSLYLFPITLVLIAGILFLSIRRLFGVVLTLLAIPIVLVWTSGISALLGLEFTIFASAVPFIVLALGIDYAIHSMNRFSNERDEGKTGMQSARRTIKHLGVALLLSSITTVAAYLSNAASSIPAVVDFGIMVAIGITCSFFVMGLFLPMVSSFFVKKGRKKKKRDPFRAVWRRFSIIMARFFSMKRNAVLVIAGALILTAVWSFGALNLERTFEPGEVLPEDSPWLEAEEMLTKYFPQKADPYQVLIRGDITSREVLSAIQNVTLVNSAEDSPIYRIGNWSDLDEEGIKNMFDGLFENDPTIGQVLHRSGNEYDAAVIRIRAEDRGSIDLSALEGMDDADHILTGQKITYDIIISEISNSMLTSLVISIIVCAIVVSLVFQSPRIGIITLLPVSIMTVWLLGTMNFIDFSLNIVSIIIVVTAIGVGIDYSIHITNSFITQRDLGKEREKALSYSLQTSGLSLVGAALTTSLGFFILVFSPMRGFNAFGVLTPIMILFSLLGAIIILPAMLMLSDRLPYLKDVHNSKINKNGKNKK